MRKYITLFAAAYIMLFSTTAANAQSSPSLRFCNVVASAAENVQMHRQNGLSPQQIANRHAKFISEAYSGIGDADLRRASANQMAEITQAIIEDAFTYPIQPSYELQDMVTNLFKYQVYELCINS